MTAADQLAHQRAVEALLYRDVKAFVPSPARSVKRSLRIQP